MKFEIRSYSHAVGEFNYHIQITPAYRRAVMENDKVDKLVKAYIKRILQNYPKFSKRTLKEQNLAISEAANFVIGIIQSSLR